MAGLDARVTAQGLGHQFVENHWLFRNLSFDLVPHHVYAVTGPSGSGKSTLLAIIAGWLNPTEGSVTRKADTVRWVFQNPHGVARRTALDHVSLAYIGQGFTRKEADKAAMDMLSRFHLEDIAGSPFSALSGGEAQRLMLARGLATSPDVFLIDEPTAQLDRTTADEVNSVMSSLARQGIVVIATHDPHTRAMCTDVIDLTGDSNHLIGDAAQLPDEGSSPVEGIPLVATEPRHALASAEEGVMGPAAPTPASSPWEESVDVPAPVTSSEVNNELQSDIAQEVQGVGAPEVTSSEEIVMDALEDDSLWERIEVAPDSPTSLGENEMDADEPVGSLWKQTLDTSEAPSPEEQST